MPAGVYASVSHATLLGMSHSDIVHHCSLKLANHQSMHAHHSSVDKKKNHHKEVMLAAAAARHTSFDNFIPSIVPLPKSKTVNNTMANSSVVSVILHQASVLPLKKCWMAIADNYIYFYRRFGELPRLILDTKQCDLTFSTSEPDCPERVMEAAMKRLLSKNPHSTAAPKPILKKVSFIVSTTTADVSFEPEGESDNESVETVSSPVKAKLMEKKQSGVNNSNRASSNGNGAGNDNPRKRSVGSVVSSVAGGNSISSSAKSNKSKSPTKSVHHHVIPSIYDNVVIAPLTIGVLGATDTFRLCSAMMATFRKFSTLQVKSDLIASELQKTLNLIHRYQSEFVSCNSELNALKHKHNTGISEITHQSKANHVLQHQFHAEEKLFFRQRDLLNGKIANYKAMIAMETENLQSLVNTGSRFLKIHRALISRSVAMLDSHNMLPMLQHHDIVLDASVNSIRDERRAGVAQIIDVNLINHMAIEKDLQQLTEFKKKQEPDEENHKNQESVALGSNVETTMGVLKVVTKFMKVVAGKRKIEAAIAASVAADKAAAAEEAQVEKMKLLGLTQSSGIPRRTSKPEGREAEMNTKKDTKRIIAPKAEKSTTSDKVQVFGLRQAASQLVRQLSYYFDINIYMSDLLKYPIQVPIPGSKAQYRELINAGHKPISALVHSSRHAVKKPKKNGGKRNKKKGGRGKTEGDTSSVVSKNNSLQSGTTAIRHILSGKNTKPGQPDSKNSLNSKIPKKTYFKDANITTIVELINSRNNSRAASRAATRDGAVTDDVPLSIDTSLFHSNDIKGDGSESDASISSYSDTESNDSGETRKHGVMVHQYESASKSRYKSRSKVKLEKFK